jgi:hypothetical protein
VFVLLNFAISLIASLRNRLKDDFKLFNTQLLPYNSSSFLLPTAFQLNTKEGSGYISAGVLYIA